jgi:hypothetical protein
MLQEKIYDAKVKNWIKLVQDRADKLCEIRKDDEDIFVQLLTGDIFDEAVNQIAVEIQAGIYDDMLMPKEYNL